MELPSRMGVFLGLCVLVVMATMVYFRSLYVTSPNIEIVQVQRRREHFLVDSPSCKIPDIDAFDPSIKGLIDKGKPLYCGYIDGLTYQIDDVVFVNKTVVKKLYAESFTYCDSETVVRVERNSDNRYKYIANNAKFNYSYTLSKEFTRIRCYNTSKSVIHYNFYAINTPKPEAEARFNKSFPVHVKNNSIKHSYNVLLMGIDSVSRLNFIRHLKQTRQYLLKNVEAIDMTGYNKVADNTFVNMAPFLAGKYVPELPYSIKNDKRKSFDEYNMIFKQFRTAGYRTLWAEDDPFIATFNYIKEGFHKAPVDDYMRPMSVAMENEDTLRKNHAHCVHERGEHDIYLDYIYRFVKANTIANRPFFSFSFLTRITHYWMNKAALADGHHVNFLKRIHESKLGLLNNTIMLYFSDHGMRYGSIRDTFIGKMSARLPALYVYLPPAFKKDNPKLYRNVIKNSHRLTTPFDIYETLHDILYFNSSVGRPGNLTHRGISLFSEIPETRTCKHADIEPHWCACANQEPMSTNDSIIVQSADFLVKYLNKQTDTDRENCETLKLDRITAAYKVVPNINMLTHGEKVTNVESFQKKIAVAMHYEITIVTSPGGGRFEATVKHLLKDNKLEVTGGISRTNIYGDTSWCAKNTQLKKICYCKKQKS